MNATVAQPQSDVQIAPRQTPHPGRSSWHCHCFAVGHGAHRAHGMVEGKAASIGLQSASEVMLDAFSDATAIFSLSSLDGVQAQYQRHRMLR